MSDATALKIALGLLQLPSRVRAQREEPLPEGMLLLLRVAAREPEAIDEAAILTGKNEETLFTAATFFIEQIILKPDSDSFVLLGAQPNASIPELRRNLALLLKWLHPDLHGKAEQTVFITRVTGAWNDLKTPERHESYINNRGGRALRPAVSDAARGRRTVAHKFLRGGGDWRRRGV
jgi:hypothetical protein